MLTARVRPFKLAAIFLLLSSFSIYPQNYAAATQSGIDILQQWYQPATGIYSTTGWWNSANIITLLANADKLKRSRALESVIANTFVQAPHENAGFLNVFYDDEGWWALAWIAAYDATGKQAYLATGKSIFADMTTGWDSTCGGGIWWTKKKTYKNAIANELFLSVAAHLANRTHGDERSTYTSWATREWTWFQQSGMINSDSLINDGLTKSCENNHATIWTYNQGVVLGGLAELSRLTRSPDYAAAAQRIALAATQTLVDSNGILHESCESHCSADAVQFKGIFLRNLGLLQQLHTGGDYKQFINANAASILAKDRDPTGHFGQSWSGVQPGAKSGPPTPATAGTQSSALDAILVAASVIH
jgi:predicted alpha-1,6-mannanase (GH76 family)